MAEETKLAEVEETKATKKPAAKKAAAKKAAAKKEEVEVKEYETRPALIKDFSIIKYVIVTEETQKLEQKNNTMVFAVDKKASKPEIKAAIQAIFRAKVESVNTINVPVKTRRVGRFEGKLPQYKKAFVKFDSSYDLGKITAAVASEERQANDEEK
jgi:large subunit ribosomal protein L23